MDMTDRIWLEADASAQAAVDADTREEAYELFLAEATRCRLVDRRGDVAVQVRSGEILRGRQVDADVEAYLSLRVDDSFELLVNADAVVVMTGGAPSLRREGGVPRTLGSWLREAWGEECSVRALLLDGSWRHGELDFVGADHVTLRTRDALVTLPLAAVEAWGIG